MVVEGEGDKKGKGKGERKGKELSRPSFQKQDGPLGFCRPCLQVLELLKYKNNNHNNNHKNDNI